MGYFVETSLHPFICCCCRTRSSRLPSIRPCPAQSCAPLFWSANSSEIRRFIGTWRCPQSPSPQLAALTRTQKPTPRSFAFCNYLICTLTSSTSRVLLQSVASHSAAAMPARWAPLKSKSIHFFAGMRRRIALNWQVIGATTEIVIFLCGLLKTCSSISLIMKRWHFFGIKEKKIDNESMHIRITFSRTFINIFIQVEFHNIIAYFR